MGVIAGIANHFPNDHILPGDDDGLVSVESTKLEGMTDFVVVQTGHSAMRYSSAVANQVVRCLKNGRFLNGLIIDNLLPHMSRGHLAYRASKPAIPAVADKKFSKVNVRPDCDRLCYSYLQ